MFWEDTGSTVIVFLIIGDGYGFFWFVGAKTWTIGEGEDSFWNSLLTAGILFVETGFWGGLDIGIIGVGPLTIERRGLMDTGFVGFWGWRLLTKVFGVLLIVTVGIWLLIGLLTGLAVKRFERGFYISVLGRFVIKWFEKILLFGKLFVCYLFMTVTVWGDRILGLIIYPEIGSWDKDFCFWIVGSRGIEFRMKGLLILMGFEKTGLVGVS